MTWLKWRIVLDRIATLHEIETYWTLEDLFDAHEALNIREALEKEAYDRATQEANNKSGNK